VARIDDSPPLQLDDLEALNEAPRGSSVPSVRVPEGLAACLSEVGIAVIETDGAHAVRSLNIAAERLTGWPRGRAIGAPLDTVFHIVPAGSGALDAVFSPELGAATPEHTALIERPDGQVIPVRHVLGKNDGGTGSLVVFRDVNAQQFLALQLARQARYDVLTGLLNRTAFGERVEQALAEHRLRGGHSALLYFDLDRFRLVNATCGHEAGDDLLQWVATRLHEFVGPSDSAGRIGGDEFALLLVSRELGEAERLAHDVQRRLLEFRFGFQEKTFSVGASFGLVPFGAEMRRSADVLSAADHACRQAKDAGRGRISVYVEDAAMAEARSSIQWVASIQRHLEEGGLRLFAQTIHALSPGAGKGAHFEVLCRHVGEDGQLHSPVAIIQAAENAGLMDAIDRFVVRQAFRVIGALPQRALRRLETCAINLSGISLLREGLLDYIVDEMQRSRVPPSKICFEITETAALANLGEVLWLMQELGGMGCRFAIDDFGSGHASYGYLESLPVDYVKIDGVFIRDLTDNALHRAIVESVHRIGCTLGIKTVAESVETQPIADLLMGMGVHYAQGWLYGRPKPIGEICADLDADPIIDSADLTSAR
jgi:diguanylate cyclase (GGDEF)-like protein